MLKSFLRLMLTSVILLLVVLFCANVIIGQLETLTNASLVPAVAVVDQSIIVLGREVEIDDNLLSNALQMVKDAIQIGWDKVKYRTGLN